MCIILDWNLSYSGICMLLWDGVYKRVPLFWMVAGILFLLLGFGGGDELRFFFAYMLFGALCIARSA